MITIYRLVNRVNNKCYVGVTNNYRKRMREHSYASKEFVINRAIRKYGWENFTSEILFETKDVDLAYEEAESLYIKIFGSKDRNRGYNVTDGGQGTPGYQFSGESKRKMRLSKLGKKQTKEQIENRRKSNLENYAKRKEFTLISPTGEKVIVKNITKFCVNNGLRYQGMWRVIKGLRNHHKGWKVSK